MLVREYIKDKILVFDGAMGTMLQKSGLKLGENPEQFNFTHEEKLIEIHKKYIDSGAKVITTNTFGANELKLKNISLSVEDVIKQAVKLANIAREDTECFIALDIGPIGELLEPMGTLSFEKAVEIFKRQIKVGVKSGVDLILIETMTDLYEMKAAIIAAKETCDLPVFATMSFEENGRTFTGCLPESMAVTLEGLGVDALGVNCSLGPKELKPIVERIIKNTNLTIMVQPNAGLPKISNGEAVYDISPEEFCDYVEALVDIGVSVIGGCCGTTPDFIRNISNMALNKTIFKRTPICNHMVTTPSKVVEIDEVRIIGERINPTGKKRFKEAILQKDMDYILRQAIEQIDAGAEILDVNVGLPQINEADMIETTIKEIQSIVDTPLQIDSGNIEAIERALRVYNGKPIVNSVNGEDKSLETILPLVKKYGAAVVGLTLDSNGIPKSCDERVKIAKKIVKKALEVGIKKEDIYIDCLTLTVSAQQEEVMETLKALKKVKEELGVKTVLGVSNISFGLPNRELINETFLALALGAGLDLPIINPNKQGMLNVVNVFKVLNNNDKNAQKYIETYRDKQIETHVLSKNIETKSTLNQEDVKLEDAILQGLKSNTRNLTQELLRVKSELEIVNEFLIPALDKVGEKYEKGEIFLPQLIQSAETVKEAFDLIKDSLSKNNRKKVSKGKIILATVKGDIHDIGKNIVKVILENYGYDILDLGKDVPIEKVVKEALEHNIQLVGLSALMTTTIKSMHDTIIALKKANFKGKVMVGGAVVTEDYANEMGADFYAKDAKDSVEIAKIIFS
ncbi:homocysteine methyltransferase [Clostridium botulinum]|uniref:homocysteine S-methyltransferase family protein n=2 Tax=Clostridium botulinum TaxID=1491 RepID=UPI0004D5F738|nr:homocysteine S-methyltransferase family protein [Clostridium botulinum]KEI07034.1 homocysteine methyltransferase [Clostridium botulinum C/D str. BKT75002]KEI12111.1 homocysteine methyltransferase [Clostridium botulinum C/D str. BKT2873]KGM96811.1 homocysteine methyltransferase [Clostridium botulinum D str. CCUG 7971]KOC48626.1 homocysteine methyltransferase [Clostridium botulinum]KOC52269.1 homocysteine methyltransferase [Clostridium botulinum]